MSEQKAPLSRRSFIAIAAAASLTAALSGCGKKEDEAPASGKGAASSQPSAATAEQTPQKGGTFKWYINNPKSIDPMYAQEAYGIAVMKQVFDTLTLFDFKNKKIVPLACEKWDASQDAKTFTFHLRKGAKFHNGDPVTSACFKYAWERACNPKDGTQGPSPVSYHLSLVEGYQDVIDGKATELKGLECPDDYTFVVHLSAPFADFPYVMVHPVTSPVPLNLGGKSPKDFGLSPIGNGPFVIDGKWEDGQVVKTKRNEDYYGEKMFLDGIEYRIFSDQQTAFREFEAGNLDLTQIPAGQAKTLVEKYGTATQGGYVIEPKHQVVNGTKASIYFFALNNEDPVLKNADVRRAINLAVNRKAICDTVFQGLQVPADNIVPPSLPGYEKGVWKYCRYDVEAAKEHMKKAGYESKTLDLKIIVNEGLDQSQAAQLIKADLEKIGIKLEIETMEFAAMLAQLNARTYQIGRAGWSADYPLMDNFLYPLLRSGNGDNYSSYKNPAFDEKLDKARSTVDEAARIKALQECDALAAEDCPILLISFPTLDWVGSSRVHGASADSIAYWHFEKAWIEKAAQ